MKQRCQVYTSHGFRVLLKRTMLFLHKTGLCMQLYSYGTVIVGESGRVHGDTFLHEESNSQRVTPNSRRLCSSLDLGLCWQVSFNREDRHLVNTRKLWNKDNAHADKSGGPVPFVFFFFARTVEVKQRRLFGPQHVIVGLEELLEVRTMVLVKADLLVACDDVSIRLY